MKLFIKALKKSYMFLRELGDPALYGNPYVKDKVKINNKSGLSKWFIGRKRFA